MPWFRVDDSFPSHPKVLRIPRKDRAVTIGLWTLAGGWCAAQLTNGNLDEHMVSELGGSKRAAEALVSVGLWERTDNGYLFHDWADWNPTREQVEGERAAARERMRKARLRRSSPEHHENFEDNSGAVAVTPSRPVPSLSSSRTNDAPKRAHKRPSDFKPNEAHARIAADLEVNLRDEFANFCDHHDSKGSTFKDWDAALRTWLRNAGKWGRSRNNPNPAPKRFDAPLEVPDDIDPNDPEAYRAWLKEAAR